MQKIIIKENAIFIADAHENENRRGFWEFLQTLKNKKIQTPQLFLMGDIFDLLIYEVKATHDFAKAYINLLEELADEIEIIYLEGNHDFNLTKFFKKVKVFSIKQQPLLC
ncbi:TPA: metallophosphoesterase, partial [Campylobacter lari]|nr:metallophosphoesterase [Campylobacter lari]